MTSLRKFCWAGLALAAFAGCGEEAQTTTPSATPTTPGPAPTTPPGPAPTATTGGNLGGDGKSGGTTTPSPTPTVKPDDDKKSDEKAAPAPSIKIDSPKLEAPKTDGDKKGDEDKDGDKKAESVKLSDEELAAIRELPADDQALALKQLVCPVSDEHLGSMDKPIKVTAEGKTFFLCCKGCKKELDKDAKSVLAKLKD